MQCGSKFQLQIENDPEIAGVPENGPLANSAIDPTRPLKPRAQIWQNGKIHPFLGPAGGFQKPNS